MDRRAGVVSNSKFRRLRQFLTHRKRDARAVMDYIARDSNTPLGDNQHAGLMSLALTDSGRYQLASIGNGLDNSVNPTTGK
jgi:hypothetical protein